MLKKYFELYDDDNQASFLLEQLELSLINIALYLYIYNAIVLGLFPCASLAPLSQGALFISIGPLF